MILAPFFAYVFNDSLQKSHLSPKQNMTIIYPGLKKPLPNPDDLANYRPISNLGFVSKLLERAVHAQLLIYLNENELLPSVQSAYRQFFSTETAVLKVVSDILLDSAVVVKIELPERTILWELFMAREGVSGEVVPLPIVRKYSNL